MPLGKRTVYALLAGLVCLNVFIRLPQTGHEAGIDSYFVHNLATAISQSGRIPWVINALGYFGWYPLSYPSAGPALISGVARLSSLTEEGAILALCLWYGVIGALTAFAMARTFRRNDTFALFVATIFSLAPRFMSFTTWSGSSRSLFMVLLPAFVWALIRSYRKPTLANVFVLVSVLTLMVATHRLTILLAVVMIAFVVAYVFILLERVVRLRFPRVLLSRGFRRWTPALALVAIVGVASFMVVRTDILRQYTQGTLCAGSTFADEACNLSVSITRSVGLSILFVIPGVVYVVRARNKGFLETFLSLSLLALIPTLFLRQYTGFYILPFTSLFAGLGIWGIMTSLARRPRAGAAFGLCTVIIITGTSGALLQWEVSQATTISDANYSTALYLASLPTGSFVANDGLLTVRIAAISGRQGLPVGGLGTTSQSPELLIMGAFNASDIFSKERRIPLTNLTIEDDSPFLLVGIDALGDWTGKVLLKPVQEVSDKIVQRYGLQYFVENDQFRSAFIAFNSIYREAFFNKFADSVHAQRYKVYDGSAEDIYLAFPPLTG